MERPERDDRLRAVRETIDVLVGQGERGLKGVLRASLLLKMEKVGGGGESAQRAAFPHLLRTLQKRHFPVLLKIISQEPVMHPRKHGTSSFIIVKDHFTTGVS